MDINFKLSKQHLYLTGFMAAMVLLPWSLRLSVYALLIMSIGGLLSSDFTKKGEYLKSHPQVWWFALLFFLYVTGLFYTSNIYEGIKSIEQKLSLLLIPLLAATSSAFNDSDRKRALLLFVLSVTLLTFTCFAYNAFLVLRDTPYMQLNFDPHTQARFNQFHEASNAAWMRFSYIAFSNSNLEPAYFSVYVTFSTLILYHYEPASKKIIVLKYALILWFSVIVVLLASRMGIFVFTLLCTFNLAWLLLKKKTSIPRISMVVSGFWIFILALILFFPVTRFRLIEEPLSTPLQIPSNAADWNSINLRLLEWKSGIESIGENRIIGTGTGDVLNTLSKRYDQVELGDFKKNYDSHNQYLETYLEIGILGFAALLLCLAISFRFALQQKNILLVSLIMMMSLSFLTASMLERGRGIIFLMLFISLFMFTNHSIVKTDDYIK